MTTWRSIFPFNKVFTLFNTIIYTFSVYFFVLLSLLPLCQRCSGVNYRIPEWYNEVPEEQDEDAQDEVLYRQETSRE
ncbi:MAG: hypothetical protein ACRD5J_11685 [Nitrososphaeraceae archaeon]